MDVFRGNNDTLGVFYKQSMNYIWKTTFPEKPKFGSEKWKDFNTSQKIRKRIIQEIVT